MRIDVIRKSVVQTDNLDPGDIFTFDGHDTNIRALQVIKQVKDVLHMFEEFGFVVCWDFVDRKEVYVAHMN